MDAKRKAFLRDHPARYVEGELRLIVDVDGTLCRKDDFPNLGEPFPEAVAMLRAFKALGWKVFIQSCRCSPFAFVDPYFEGLGNLREHLIDWLTEHKIPHDWVDDGQVGKLVGDLYLDDRSVTPCWEETPEASFLWKSLLTSII